MHYMKGGGSSPKNFKVNFINIVKVTITVYHFGTLPRYIYINKEDYYV
jgi:hypothetical protein